MKKRYLVFLLSTFSAIRLQLPVAVLVPFSSRKMRKTFNIILKFTFSQITPKLHYLRKKLHDVTAVAPRLTHTTVKRNSRFDAPFPRYDDFPEPLHSQVRPCHGPKYCPIRPNFNRSHSGPERYPPAKFQVDCSQCATRSVLHSDVRKMSEKLEKLTLAVFRSGRFSTGFHTSRRWYKGYNFSLPAQTTPALSEKPAKIYSFFRKARFLFGRLEINYK